MLKCFIKSIVVIVGGDVGAGKTTHTSLLVRYFNLSGLKASYRVVKAFHNIAYYLALLIAIIRYKPKPILNACKHKYSPVRILQDHDPCLFLKLFTFLSWLHLMALFIAIAFRYYLSKLFTEVLVFEDHVVGYTNELIYFWYTLRDNMSRWAKIAWLLGFNILTSLAVKSDAVTVFLYADVHELEKRWLKRETIREPEHYILAGRVAIEILSKTGLKIHYINTSRHPKEVFEDVVKYVCNYSLVRL